MRMRDGEYGPEVGYEIGVVRNIRVLVIRLRMGEWVSGGMYNCLQELRNLKKKKNGLLENSHELEFNGA